MNISMLSTLVAILERGSFAAAAQRVGCTASAVSLQVKQLETYFGQPLFDRSARTAKPTEFARQVGAVAREVATRIEALRDRHPALAVRVSLDDSDALQADLKAGRIDIAALVRPQSGGSSRLVWQNLARQPFVILAPADAPRGSPQELLQRLPWIRYDVALTGGRIAARFVRRLCPGARCAMELRSIDAIVAMVAAGLGATVVPRPRKPLLDAYAVREVRLGKEAPARQIALVRRSTDTDNRNLDAVFDAFAAVYAARRAEDR